MSNLGMYQIMTIAAKKVGGPINLAILFGAGMLFSGFILGRLYESVKRDQNQE